MAADLKVAVIGAGSHAQSHFGMIAAEPAMRLVGVAELDPARLARAQADHGPEVASTDYREMLDRARPDVVYVVTLPGHQLPIVLGLHRAGHPHLGREVAGHGLRRDGADARRRPA